MDYYCIPLPEELQPVPISSVPLLMWDENRKLTNCIYSNNNLTVTKTGDEIWDYLVIENVAVDMGCLRFNRYGMLKEFLYEEKKVLVDYLKDHKMELISLIEL